MREERRGEEANDRWMVLESRKEKALKGPDNNPSWLLNRQNWPRGKVPWDPLLTWGGNVSCCHLAPFVSDVISRHNRKNAVLCFIHLIYNEPSRSHKEFSWAIPTDVTRTGFIRPFCIERSNLCWFCMAGITADHRPFPLVGRTKWRRGRLTPDPLRDLIFCGTARRMYG